MKIHHIAISVKNLEISKEFYQSLLGLKQTKKFERVDLGAKAIFLSAENIILEMWEFAKKIPRTDDLSKLDILGIKHIACEVRNLSEKYTELKLKGIKISKPKLGSSGGRYSFVSDPDGIPIELYEPDKDSQ